MSNKMFLSPSGGAPLLMDLYPADLGLSLFKISTPYSGYCIEVTRDSDSTSLNIGFSSGILDISTMMAFVGVGNGYIRKWYSQVGSNYAFQTTMGLMPRIVNSGVLETLNGHPSIYFDGVDDSLALFTNEVVNTDFSVFGYGKRFASGSMFAPLVTGSSTSLMHFADNNFYLINSAGFDVSTSQDTSSSSILLEGHSTVSDRDIYKNQSLVSTSPVVTSFGNSFNTIGGPYAGTFTKGHISEILLYKTNQVSNRTAIGNDIILRQS